MAVAAFTNPAAAADRIADIHTVAIISALGDEADMRTYGTMRWDNAEYTLHSNWQLDALVADDIKKSLGKKYVFKIVSVDTKALAAAALNRSVWHPYNPLGNVQDLIAGLPRQDGLDAYIAVVPILFVRGGIDWRGITVTRSPGLLGDGTTSLEAFYIVGLYDAATGKKLAGAVARYPAAEAAGAQGIPEEFCSNELWADSVQRLTPAQNDRLRLAVSSLINGSLAYALADIGLITQLEAKTATQALGISNDASCRLTP